MRCLAAVRSVEGFFAFVWLRDLLVVGNSMSVVCVSLHDYTSAVLSCTALPLCCAVLCSNFIWQFYLATFLWHMPCTKLPVVWEGWE